MKPWIALMLVFVVLLGALPTAVAEWHPSADAEQAELERAAVFGFGTLDDLDRDATYAQFMRLVDRAVELADPSKLDEWKTRLPEARAAERALTRADAAVILYDAAILLGERYTQWNEQREARGISVHIDMDWDRWNTDEILGVTGEKFDTVPESDILHEWNSYDLCAFNYSLNRESVYSNKSLLEYDFDLDTMRVDENLTEKEALLAALRLYDSGLTSERYLTDADRGIIANADARRAEILASQTDVKVKGKSYYVSNDGDDSNDGRSPETPWATVDKVNAAKLKKGDGVFFQRGGVWRDRIMYCKPGVTYSAYGEGAKPQFLGSPEDGANEGFWTPVDGYDNVWVYHIEMQEVGMILCDDDAIVLDKYIAFWDVDSQRFVVSLDMQTPFSLDLLEDNQFFCDIDLRGLEGGQVGLGPLKEAQGATSFTQNGSSLALWSKNVGGKLYLRCDEGNPGAVYRTMEFAKSPYDGPDEGGVVIQVEKNCTLDNLCVKYASNTALMVREGCTVKHCEISYIGGGALVYTPIDKFPEALNELRDLVCADDGVSMTFDHPSNVTIADNYIHDNMNTPCNLEHYLDGTYENIRISGNLFERNGNAFCMTNFFPNDNPEKVRYKDITIDDNYVTYTGYGFDRGLHGHLYPLHTYSFFSAKQFKNVKYTNNVFYLTKGAFFCLSENATLDAFTFSGNTYAHNNGGILLWDTTNGFKRLNYEGDVEQTIIDLTGDQTAVVLPPSFAPNP